MLSFVAETRQYSRQITKCHIYQCFTNLYSKFFQPLTVFSKSSILDVFSYDSNTDDDECLSDTLGDVLMISESKLHSSFLDGQFLIETYSALFRVDWKKLKDDIIIFIRSDIPANLLSIGIGF